MVNFFSNEVAELHHTSPFNWQEIPMITIQKQYSKKKILAQIYISQYMNDLAITSGVKYI